MIKNTIIVIFVISWSILHAKEVQYKIEDILKSDTNYLTGINTIIIKNNSITLTGERDNKSVINKVLINDILRLKDETNDPECIIDHSKEEYVSYIDFQENLATVPFGHDGSRVAYNWEKSEFKQNVELHNLNRDSYLANAVFNADVQLKKLIMGKKSTRLLRLPSFVGYAQMHSYEFISKTYTIHCKNRFETIFYLRPDSLFVDNKAEETIIKKVKFKLVSYLDYNNSLNPNFMLPGLSKSNNDINSQWANKFNAKYYRLIKKQPFLKEISDIFLLYYAIKNYYKHSEQIIGSAPFQKVENVPDQIESIKLYALITQYPALIWLLVSGAITFDYSTMTQIMVK